MKSAHRNHLYSTLENSGINARMNPIMLITPATVMNMNLRSKVFRLRIITCRITACEVVLNARHNAPVDENNDTCIVEL